MLNKNYSPLTTMMTVMSVFCSFQGTSRTVSSFSFQTNTITNKSQYQWQIKPPNHVCHGQEKIVSQTSNRMYDKNDVSISYRAGAKTALFSSIDGDEGFPVPTNFREAEIIGLRLMQEGRYADALEAFNKALKLPGSKLDVIRTKNVSGPSPVGGATGGTEGKEVWSLDEFELQAAYYNMACACSKLGEIEEAVSHLSNAYDNGFDNIGAMTSDPDLRAVQGSNEFQQFLEEINPKKKGLFRLF